MVKSCQTLRTYSNAGLRLIQLASSGKLVLTSIALCTDSSSSSIALHSVHHR